MNETHYRRLEAMYDAAPINRQFSASLRVGKGTARVEMDVGPDTWHAAGAQHGMPYFKILDDACFYAASAMVEDVFMLTSAFNLNLTRPFESGRIIAEGRWVHGKRRVFLAEGVLSDSNGNEIAFGSGTFMRGRKQLKDVPGYSDAALAAND